LPPEGFFYKLNRGADEVSTAIHGDAVAMNALLTGKLGA